MSLHTSLKYMMKEYRYDKLWCISTTPTGKKNYFPDRALGNVDYRTPMTQTKPFIVHKTNHNIFCNVARLCGNNL